MTSDRQGHPALLGLCERAHVDYVARHLFAPLVAHVDDDAVFPRLIIDGVLDAPLDLQGVARFHLVDGIGAEPQVMLASRADARALGEMTALQ